MATGPDAPGARDGPQLDAAGGAGQPVVGRGRACTDWTIALLLAAASACATWYGSRGLDALLVPGVQGDVWFEADCPRVFDNLTDPASVQSRSAVHPLATLWMYPPTALLRDLGLDPVVAVRIVRVLLAAACAAIFYALLRAVGGARPDTVLFTALTATSSGVMFWFVVPELYPPGLLSILLALLLAARCPRGGGGIVADVIVNLATLSFTITNWMAGLAATLARWPRRRAVAVLLVVMGLSGALLAVQQQFFPSAAVVPISLEEREYVLHPDTGGPARVALSFVFHSVVMPAIETVDRYHSELGPIMTVQRSWPGSAGPVGLLATILWAGLLGLGIRSMCVGCGPRRVRIVLAVTLAGQFVLHLLYGLETFTYACHFGPLLIVVAALASLSRQRRLALAVALGLFVCTGINNVSQLARARAFVQQRAARAQPTLVSRLAPAALPAAGGERPPDR